MRKTLFVYRRRGIGSAEIRAVQIAEALGCSTGRLKELTPDIGASYEVIIYVKAFPEPKLMEALQRRGVRQILDPIDEYRWWKIRRRRHFIDAFIGANLTHALFLQDRFGARAVAIPHHHCNFEELRVPPGRTPPTLGYIAGEKHWRLNRSIASKVPLPLVTSLKQTEGRVGLSELFLSVDIGFEFRRSITERRFKPATKVVNYMSFGIPSVLGLETGYVEAARHGEHCFFAHSPAEVVLWLRHLAADPRLRARMGDAGYEAARPYHIRRIAERYREILD